MLQLLKKSIIILTLLFLTGCTTTYTLTIDKNNINEKIEVVDTTSSTRTVTDIMNNYKKKFPVYDIEDVIDEDDLYQTYDNATYYNQTYNINGSDYHLYYEYTYPINKYISANSVNYSYDYKDIIYENNKLTIKTGSPNNYLKYRDIFTDLIVNIVTDYEVTNNNADKVEGNRYTWYFNKTNNYEKRIDFEVDLTKTVAEKEQEAISNKTKTKNYIITAVIAVILYIAIVSIIIIKKNRTRE